MPKYEMIRQHLSEAIASGQYQSGQRLPSESQLVKTFSASRPTVNRALRELQLTGLIERRAGSGRLVFVGRPGSAPTVDARAAGYTEAINAAQLEAGPQVCRIEPEGASQVKKVLNRLRPDGFVCANDFTAAHLLKALTDLGVAVPGKVKMGGIDDVKYASLLSVPLTTIHQPCPSMGAIAISAMIERLRDPKLPPRDILLNFHLVVRDSCGARKKDLTPANGPRIVAIP